VELAAFVAEPAFASREFAEVAGSHRTNVVVELENDSPDGLGVDFDVKLLGRRGQHWKANVGVGGNDAQIRF
jgi:hypothetical protein